MRTLLTSGTLVLPDTVLADSWLLLEDGLIHSFGTRGDGLPAHDAHHELPGAAITPALLDIHVHGAASHDVMEATAEGVSHVSRLARRGRVPAHHRHRAHRRHPAFA
jgi:N-acetylglucosamine-6-phosphate deacetylase